MKSTRNMVCMEATRRLARGLLWLGVTKALRTQQGESHEEFILPLERLQVRLVLWFLEGFPELWWPVSLGIQQATLGPAEDPSRQGREK